jgi:hypothetical protein
MYVRTNYNTGPYEILSITRGCTWASYLDTINMAEPPASPPHIHITCCAPGNPRNKYWLNGYDEETLRSVWGRDRLYVVSPQAIFKQLLFFEEGSWTGPS